MPNEADYSTDSNQIGQGQPMSEIPNELVAKIADKVYAMLLLDMNIEEERQRWPGQQSFRASGVR
jgi:hypothetical protein